MRQVTVITVQIKELILYFQSECKIHVNSPDRNSDCHQDVSYNCLITVVKIV